MLPEPLFHNLSPVNPGIVILEYARAIRKGKFHSCKNLVIQYIQVVSCPNILGTLQTQIITLPLQACMVGTGCNSCVTSSASLFTLILWNRVNLDTSDHMTFLHCPSSIFILPSKLKPFFLISLSDKCFFRATQLFSPLSSLHIVHVEMLVHSLLSIAVSSTVDFFTI